MKLVHVSGAARADSIATGIVPRLIADGWEVVTSDLNAGDNPCDLSTTEGPAGLIEPVTVGHGTLTGLVLGHAHDRESRHPRHAMD